MRDDTRIVPLENTQMSKIYTPNQERFRDHAKAEGLKIGDGVMAFSMDTPPSRFFIACYQLNWNKDDSVLITYNLNKQYHLTIPLDRFCSMKQKNFEDFKKLVILARTEEEYQISLVKAIPKKFKDTATELMLHRPIE